MAPRSVSRDDTPFEGHHEFVLDVPDNEIEIETTPLELSDDDEADLLEWDIDKIFGTVSHGGAQLFHVRTSQGDEDEITFDELRDFPGGLEALNVYFDAADASDDNMQIKLVSRNRALPVRRLPRSSMNDPFASFDNPSFTSTSDDSTGESSDEFISRSKKRRKSRRSATVARPSRRAAQPVSYADDFLDNYDESDSDSHPSKRRKLQSSRSISQLAPPKVPAVKEVFPPLPITNEFRARHRQICDVCFEMGDGEAIGKGRFVYCQSCTSSWHEKCLGPRGTRDHLVTKIADRRYVLQCRRCVDSARKKDLTASFTSHCQTCHEQAALPPFRIRKSAQQDMKDRELNDGQDPIVEVPDTNINNVDNVLFRCASCFRAFHLHHLPPRGEDLFASSRTNSDAEIAEQRFAEYCTDFMCSDCVDAPAKVSGLVAWRPRIRTAENSAQKCEEIDEDDKEYLIRWEGMSYYRATWKAGSWVAGMSSKTMRIAFNRKDEGPKFETADAIPEDYLRVDIVFKVEYNNVMNEKIEEVDLARIKEVSRALVKFKGLTYEEAEWEVPPDPKDTERWDDWKAAYEDYVRGVYMHPPMAKTLNATIKKTREVDFETSVVLKEQPKGLLGELMGYQLEGVNWLLYKWYDNHNAILGDEMGLGKTIQVIAFMVALQMNHKCWPFLVVVPNATCANWKREIKRWAPSLRVVAYFGSKDARRLALEHEIRPTENGGIKCHVVITSYETAQDLTNQKLFRRVQWAALIVDEGQRLKNDETLLFQSLSSIRVPFRLLLSGTPLQNRIRELFNLLSFLDDTVVASQLEEDYEDLDGQKITEVRDMLRPFLLRRTKAAVLNFLPPMAQVIVPVSMTSLQREIYKSTIAKNAELLMSIFAGKGGTTLKGLRNLLMELRKTLCHPFVYNREIEELTDDPVLSHQRLVDASPKLQMLSIMLPMLKENGHRVLIFSQFLDMLTIMEDFLAGLGMKHARLDGSLSSAEKQKVVDAYNAPESELFVLLLSTRAGGVGINLATADTVIILDPDFNPHQDIQAISRAHRIGQKNKVLVFQLMTRDSAEEKIIQRGKKKMALDHVFIETIEDDEIGENDLEDVLKFGAEALFKEDVEFKEIKYDKNSMKKLLDRTHIETTKPVEGQDTSTFGFAKIWQNDSGMLGNGDDIGNEDESSLQPDVWQAILQQRKSLAEQERLRKATTFGRGRRTKANVQYNGDHGDDNASRQADSDNEFSEKESDESDEESLAGVPEKVNVVELQATAPRKSTGIVLQEQQALQKLPPIPSQATRRVTIPRVIPPNTSDLSSVHMPCLGCNDYYGVHATGFCPIKIAGIEICALCGEGHIGFARACPNIRDLEQVTLMLELVKDSTEDQELVSRAKKILQGLKGSLAQDARRKMERAQKRFLEETGGAVTEELNSGVEAKIVAAPKPVQPAPPPKFALAANPHHPYVHQNPTSTHSSTWSGPSGVWPRNNFSSPYQGNGGYAPVSAPGYSNQGTLMLPPAAPAS